MLLVVVRLRSEEQINSQVSLAYLRANRLITLGTAIVNLIVFFVN